MIRRSTFNAGHCIAMSDIEFSKEEKQQLADMLQDYLREEFDVEAGRFEAEFLLDFLAKTMAPIFYNKGLSDAHALLSKQMDDYADAIYAMEKVSELK